MNDDRRTEDSLREALHERGEQISPTPALPGIPVITHDERFTSRMAFRAMIDGGLKKKDRQNKATVDKVSATIILQSYLEQQSL